VRGQLLPQARRVDTGIFMVSGKLPLDAAVRRETPPPIFKGPTLILGSRGCCMFTGAVEYPPGHPPAYDREEYVTWGFSAHQDSFELAREDGEMASANAKAAVLGQMPDWSSDLRRLVERADASSLTSFVVKSSVPIAPWPTCCVTLLGDALHNMTPFRGIGANTALRDAALLRAKHDRLRLCGGPGVTCEYEARACEIACRPARDQSLLPACRCIPVAAQAPDRLRRLIGIGARFEEQRLMGRSSSPPVHTPLSAACCPLETPYRLAYPGWRGSEGRRSDGRCSHRLHSNHGPP